MKRTFQWLEKNWPILAYPAFFFAGGIFQIYTWSESVLDPQLPQRAYLIRMFGLELLAIPAGLLFFQHPPFTLSFTSTDYSSFFIIPTRDEKLFAFLLLCLITIASVIVLWKLLQVRRYERLLRILIYANLLIGWGCSASALSTIHSNNITPLRDTPRRFCEQLLLETIAIRVQYFDNVRDEDRGLAGIPTLTQTVHSISYDSRKTWRQFMRNSYYRTGSCESMGAFNDNLLYVWQDGMFVYTHDGGMTWQTWNIRQLENDCAPNWQDVCDSQIVEVHFLDERNGEMVLNYFEVESQSRPEYTLYTNDGGTTWEVRDG